MEILFDNSTDFDFSQQYTDLVKRVALEALRYEDFREDCEISFTLVTNEEIHEINKKHRGIDKPTDVLSFPQIDFELEDISTLPQDRALALGDIIISIDKLKEQSEAYNHSFERELAFLTAHSMLHLMGYDHMTEPEEKIMFAKQEAILSQLGITR